MKILLVGTGRLPIPPPGYGGIERYLFEYAAALRTAGHTVRILNEVRPGVYTRGWTFERRLPFLLRGREEEIVHANISRAGVMLALAGIPFVYTSHNPNWFAPHGGPEALLFETERFAVRSARASVAFTDPLRRRMESVRGCRGPIVTIPLGVDTERFRSSREGDPSVALGVGEVVERKRWHLAAEAVQGTGVTLQIVGPIRDSAYAARLRAQGVELVGEVSDASLLRAFEGAGVVLHPSDREAFPGVVLQAMSCGRPVLGGATLAPVEGVLAAPSDDADTVRTFLRAQLGRMVEDPSYRRAVGSHARERVEALFAWPVVVRQHVELYRRVLAS